MPSAFGHHCPICSKIGDKRCINRGHYVECTTHKGSWHSAVSDCVKCSEAEKRAERDVKDQQDAAIKNAAGTRMKKAKRNKIKPESEKTMKQLRREEKAARISGASTSTAETPPPAP